MLHPREPVPYFSFVLRGKVQVLWQITSASTRAFELPRGMDHGDSFFAASFVTLSAAQRLLPQGRDKVENFLKVKARFYHLKKLYT